MDKSFPGAGLSVNLFQQEQIFNGDYLQLY